MVNAPQPANQEPSSDDWVLTAAHGDEELYQLMLDKEALGDSLMELRQSSDDPRATEATLGAMRQLGDLIVAREAELGIRPPEEKGF